MHDAFPCILRKSYKFEMSQICEAHPQCMMHFQAFSGSRTNLRCHKYGRPTPNPGIRSLSYIQFPTVQIPTTTFLQTEFPTHSVSYRRAFLQTEFPTRCASYIRAFLHTEFLTLTVTYKIYFREP